MRGLLKTGLALGGAVLAAGALRRALRGRSGDGPGSGRERGGSPVRESARGCSAGVVFGAAASGLAVGRDRVYALGLLVPFAVHGLALKVSSVLGLRSGGARPGETLLLVRSDLLFNLGYSLFWMGLLGAARSGPARWAAVGLFHLVTVLVMFVRAAAHQFFRQTGTTLDYPIIALWLPRLEQVRPMLVHGVPRPAWALTAAALLYAVLGPRLLAELFGRWRGWPEELAETEDARPFAPWLLLAGAVLCALSLPAGPVPADVGRSFVRDPFVNVALSALRRPALRRGRRAAPVPRSAARLVRTARTQRRGVVLVHLESTRASSVTPYNKGLGTTPFLEELAKSSLLVERAYTTVPHTSKASVSANCGIFPDPAREPTESYPGGLPARGLADLLGEEGYESVFFQSSVANFDDFGGLAENLGYREYYPLESMDTRGFERPNYFGCEDEVMLRPSERWLAGRGEGPFVAHYLTGTAHHDYRPPARYGRVRFAEDELLDRYLNCVRYQDFFLRNLIEQYKKLGLYGNTLFVIFGDHGEGFGEHGRYGHEDVPYEEGLRIPLMVHAPGWFRGGERVPGPANLTDILPTVLDLLGYEVEGGDYPGHSLLRPLPGERILRFSCFNEGKCLASLDGSIKYVHHYDDRSDELFDLAADPLERRNLAGERPAETRERRRDLLAWYSAENARYEGLYGG